MSKTLKEMQVGFHFSFVDDSEDQANGFELMSKATHRFEELAKQLPCWSVKSEHPDDDFYIYPYEVAEVDEIEEGPDNTKLISIWVAANVAFPADHISQFKKAAEQAVAECGQEMGIKCAYFKAKTYTVWQVTEFADIEVA